MSDSFDFIKKFFVPDTLTLREQDDVIFPSDCGIFRTHKEWEEIKRKIDKFYKLFSDEELEEHNRKILNHEYPHPPIEKLDKHRKEAGYVYLLHHDGTYKIGISKNVPNRRTQIGTKMPHEVTLIQSIKTDDMVELEALLHERYAGKRMNGEWFALTNEDVRTIKAEGAGQ
ncbi:MAG: hypothetical protein DDT21_02294 [Syntrophomonadaceae bacterium]|nr:hypothetical protein [Bacillota bacterium]